MYRDLVNIWRENFGECENREKEFDTEMEQIRQEHDVNSQEAEATFTLKINELRQANDNENIQRAERSLERLLESMLLEYKRFTTQQISTIKAFGNVMEKETEVYQINLQEYCDMEEENLLQIEPWKVSHCKYSALQFVYFLIQEAKKEIFSDFQNLAKNFEKILKIFY